MKNKKTITGKIIRCILLLLVAFVFIFPLYYIMNISLKTSQEFIMNPNSITKSFHWKNYISAWKDAKLSSYFLNTVLYTVVCTAVNIVMTIFLAFPISRGYIKHSKLLSLLFVSSVFLPDSMIPKFQIFLNLHLYNTRAGYILWLLGVYGVTLFFFEGFIKGIPREFDEAANIDGCGYFKYVFTMLIPMMKSAIATMGILSAIGVWNNIMAPTVILYSEKYLPITRGLLNFSGTYSVNWTELSAAMIIVALPLVVIYCFFQRYIIESAVSSGIKG